MENNNPKAIVDMEHVLGRFLRRAANIPEFKDISISDFVRLAEMYDTAYVEIIMEAHKRLEQLEADWKEEQKQEAWLRKAGELDEEDRGGEENEPG